MWITELINNIPELVGVIAPGFLFVNSFMWIKQGKFSSGTSQIVTSVVASYFVNMIYSSVSENCEWIGAHPGAGLIILCALCLLLGTLAGKIYKSELLNYVLNFFRLYRTVNDSVIEDIIGDNSWMAVFDQDNKTYICGKCRYGNSENGNNYVSLSSYYIADENKEVIEDYAVYEDKRQVLINLNDYKLIIFSKEDPFAM